MLSAAPLPTPAYNRNFDWIVSNFPTLVEQHPNRWVAVHQERVLAADSDLDEVHRLADGRAPHDEVVFYFVDDGSLILAV